MKAMKEEIIKATNEFVVKLLQIVDVGMAKPAMTTSKPRGMAALSPEERSEVAKRAAATRKLRAAGKKAAATRKRNSSV